MVTEVENAAAAAMQTILWVPRRRTIPGFLVVVVVVEVIAARLPSVRKVGGRMIRELVVIGDAECPRKALLIILGVWKKTIDDGSRPE